MENDFNETETRNIHYSSLSEELSLIELNILLQHLRLGLPHLQKQFNSSQLDELLNLEKLCDAEREGLKPTAPEKSGSFTLIINMVFTSILGTWIGTAGFMGFNAERSDVLITIIIIAIILSLYLGYYNFQNKKKDIKKAFDIQKLHNLELTTIKLMCERYKKNIRHIISYLNQAHHKVFPNKEENLSELSLEIQETFSLKKDIEPWLNNLSHILEKKLEKLKGNVLYNIYENEVKLYELHIKKDLSPNLKTDPSNNGQWLIESKKPSQYTPIELLTSPYFTSSQSLFSASEWVKSHFLSILKDFIPTLVGGFSSIFLYFGGSSALAKAFGNESVEEALKQSYFKWAALITAVLITLYFGYAFLQDKYKSYEREKVLEIRNGQIKYSQKN